VSPSGRYPYYRCPPTGDCDNRVTIAAEYVETAVVAEVKRLLAGLQGTAQGADTVADAAADLERAQASYDAAMLVLDPLEPAAVTRLGQLRAARDQARQRHDDAAASSTATSIAVTAGDWDRLTLAEQRALIRAVTKALSSGPAAADPRGSRSPRSSGAVPG
jgi:hypothetical protein